MQALMLWAAQKKPHHHRVAGHAHPPGKAHATTKTAATSQHQHLGQSTAGSAQKTSNHGILADTGAWLIHHPIAIPVLLVALIIGAQYGWSQWRKKQQLRGVAVRPLGPILRDQIRFGLKEDTRPLHPKTPWLTGRRLYGVLAALVFLGVTVGLPGIPWPPIAVVLLLSFAARYSKVARARRSIVQQMFAVAAGECRYPKGAELAPWSHINIQNWTNLIQPGTTAVIYPAAYQSEDLKTREKFERQFNGTVSDENSWTYTWESAKNRVVCTPAAHLPSMAPYPGPGPKWDEIPVGIGPDGKPVSWQLASCPHLLVGGPTGTGKSVLQRTILFHCLAHADTWKIVGVDPKRVELGWLGKYENVLKIAMDLDEGVEVVRNVRDEMMRRFEEMEESGVNHFQLLASPPPALLVMIDETYAFLAPENIKSEEGKERDAQHAAATTLLGEIARLGRAAGVHLVMATQRPDVKAIPGELKNNADARIAAGRMDTMPSLMILDSEAATRLPKIKGRGILRLGGEMTPFQGYFAEGSWFDEWLAQQQAAVQGEPLPMPAGGPRGEPGAAGRRRLPGGGVLQRLKDSAEARAAGLDGTDVPMTEPVQQTAGAAGPRAGGLFQRMKEKAAARAAALDGASPADSFGEAGERLDVTADDASVGLPDFADRFAEGVALDSKGEAAEVNAPDVDDEDHGDGDGDGEAYEPVTTAMLAAPTTPTPRLAPAPAAGPAPAQPGSGLPNYNLNAPAQQVVQPLPAAPPVYAQPSEAPVRPAGLPTVRPQGLPVTRPTEDRSAAG